MKTCSCCKIEKSLSEFYASTSETRGLRHSSACKACTRARAADLKAERGYSERWRRKHEAPEGTKWCPQCQDYRPLAEFALRSRGGVKKAGDYVAWCYACASDRRKRYFHGVSQDEYDAMLIAQDYRCASCRDSFRAMNGRHIGIDHCHTTGKVRGVLCNHCNLALGHLRDDPVRIDALRDYLNASRESH